MRTDAKKAADGQDVSAGSACGAHRKILDLADVLIGYIVDIEADQIRA